MNPFAVFARSWQGLNLSPGERAFMKVASGVLFTAVGSGLLIAVQQFTTGNTDLHAIAVLAGGAAAKTLFDAVKKYLSAQTDVPLSAPSLVTQPDEPVVQPEPPFQFTTPVPQPPVQAFNASATHIQPIPSQFSQFGPGPTMPYPNVPGQ